jgi:hypothetical protein
MFKSRFEEIIAKGKTGPVISFREVCCLSAFRADKTAEKVQN